MTARVQWIEAQATQALPSSSQLDMWIGSGAADAPMQQTEQKRARTEDPTANHKKLVRMMENLDYRLRQLEGATPCFFLPLEGCGLAQAMQAAAAYYDGRSPGKGKPHPDKHRKTTLAGALVKFAAERVAATFSGSASSPGPDGQASCSSTPAFPCRATRDDQGDVPPHGNTDSYGARSHRLQLLEGQEGHQVRADCPVPAARGLGAGDAVHRVRDPRDGRVAFVGRAAEGSPSEGPVNADVL